MNAPSRTRRSESGQALVVFAVLLVGLVAMLALVLDGGSIYLSRRRMQNAADAGAMAGARVLAGNGSTAEVTAAAQDYAITRNGATTCDVTIDGSSVTVVTGFTVPATFARVLGLEGFPVTAQATARMGPVSGLGGLAPISIRDFDYQFGMPYWIWDSDKDEDPLTGNISGSGRGWLTLDCKLPTSCVGAGASTLTEWMRNGYPGMINTDDWVFGNSGTKASVITEASVGDLLRIVVYDTIQSNYYHVVHFAAFRVIQVQGTTDKKGIRGVFEYFCTAGPPGSGPDGGVRTFDLTH